MAGAGADRPSRPDTCAMCPKMCRFTCPVARARDTEAVHPTGLGTSVVGAQHGVIPWSEAGTNVYACTMCLGCNTYCALDQDVPGYLRPARAEAVNRGVAPPAVYEVARRAEETASPYGVPPTAALEALQPGSHPDRSAAETITYVPSCTALARTPEVARSVTSVLAHAGFEVQVVHPGCCGGVFSDLGFPELAEQLGAKMRDAIAQAGGERLVTDGPLCARTLGATPFPDLAAELIAGGSVPAKRRPVDVTYHDPCILGRHLGSYDPAREVLGALFGRIMEPQHTKGEARCSGGGGGLPATDPEASRAIAAERLAELEGTGADLIVSACPRCKVQFRGSAVPVRDLAEVVAMGLEDTEAST
jgi:Fe-S oxidoreductase